MRNILFELVCVGLIVAICAPGVIWWALVLWELVA